MSTLTFPHTDTLCEDCGYPLKGLQASGGCPECGLAIEASSPDRRTGPGWQDRPGAQAAFHIVIALMVSPRSFFRGMRVDGGNGYARLFMALGAGLIGAGWFIGAHWVYRIHADIAAVHAGIVTLSVILLSYIEALGVVFFSTRRGWRVPMKLAERIVCYCSMAWAPAAGVMGVVLMIHDRGLLDRGMTRLFGVWQTWQSIGLMVLIGSVAMLWFEVLVWIGVRQTKHANSSPGVHIERSHTGSA